MTGVLAFFFLFTSTQSSQSRTPHSFTIKTTIMSQSFTSMDARTQYLMDEFGIYELIESNGQTVKQYIARDKDTPVYPEPEGDPSY